MRPCLEEPDAQAMVLTPAPPRHRACLPIRVAGRGCKVWPDTWLVNLPNTVSTLAFETCFFSDL
jgi:hypothetical protein